MNKLIHYLQRPRYLAAAIAIASAGILSMAYISQYGFGLKPCILCLYQRGPYALNIVLGILAVVASFRYPRLTTLIIYITAVSFFAGAVIAGFHVGVENGWWKGLPACGGDIVPQHASIEELRRSLEGQAIVRCDKAAWVMFGISMAGYNFMMSLALTFGVVYMLRKKHGA
jgi:disulfide bond formation protein DsbB